MRIPLSITLILVGLESLACSWTASGIQPEAYGLPARLSNLTQLQLVTRPVDITPVQKTEVLMAWLMEERRNPTPTSPGLGGGDISSSYIQAQIVKAMAEVGNPVTLRAIAADEKIDADVRDGARIALCLMGDGTQIPMMIDILEHSPEPDFRATAAGALGRLAATEARQALTAALYDRYQATGSYKRAGSRTVYPVAEAARSALRVLNSKDPELKKRVEAKKAEFEKRLEKARKDAAATAP